MVQSSIGILLEGGSVQSRKTFVDSHIVHNVSPLDVFRVGGEAGGLERSRKEESPTIGINDVRAMKRDISLKHIRPVKVVIEEAQRLTIPAQNALLKILEEPPKNVQFVLTVPHRGRLLPTIQSRLIVQRIIDRAASEESHLHAQISPDLWESTSREWAEALDTLLPKLLSETRANFLSSIQNNEPSKEKAEIVRTILQGIKDHNHHVNKKLLAATLIFSLYRS